MPLHINDRPELRSRDMVRDYGLRPCRATTMPGFSPSFHALLLRISNHALGKHAHDHQGQSDDGKRRKHQAENHYKQQQPGHVKTFFGVKCVVSNGIVRIVRLAATGLPILTRSRHRSWCDLPVPRHAASRARKGPDRGLAADCGHPRGGSKMQAEVRWAAASAKGNHPTSRSYV
jgi:hypothetical protein